MHFMDAEEGVVLWESCYWLYDHLRGQPKKIKVSKFSSRSEKMKVSSRKLLLEKSRIYMGRLLYPGLPQYSPQKKVPKTTRASISTPQHHESRAISQAHSGKKHSRR